MSADLTATEEDAAFRAKLAPLASEVLPGVVTPVDSGPESATRHVTSARRQLVSPAATATQAMAAVASPSSAGSRGRFRRWLGARSRTGVANATIEAGLRTRWWFVALAGIAVIAVEAWLLHRPQSATVPARLSATIRTDAPSLSPTASEDMVGLLMQRGDAALADGDIVAARLLFERGAALGSAAAAMAAGKTYDGDFLLRAGARGIRADPAAATVWVRKAAALGDPEARAQLAGQNDVNQNRTSQSKP